MRRFIALAALLAFVSACSPHQALILSDPPGASVLINGRSVGETPLYYDYSLSSGKGHQVEVIQAGYEQVKLTIVADKTDAGAMKRWLMAGVIWSPLWLGTLFTKQLKESYLFVMKRDAPVMTAQID
jgi:hypothetical protein